jgi:hypothetical protein
MMAQTAQNQSLPWVVMAMSATPLLTLPSEEIVSGVEEEVEVKRAYR